MTARRWPPCPGLSAVAAIVLAAACAAPSPPPTAPEPWPSADALFQHDPRWLGGDAVYSVHLGSDRILWLFGDSFVAPDGHGDRRSSTMVRNTLAIQQGRDPERAKIAFHWRTAADGRPTAFFGDDGEHGYWPLHGHRLVAGPLLLFQTRVRHTPGQGLGFAIDGWRLLCIDDPDAAPEAWSPRELAVAATPTDISFGTAVWRDGSHILVLGTRGNGPHRGVLARFAIDDVGHAPLPLQIWNGARWAPASPDVAPAEVLPDAGPECSVHRHDGGWLQVQSRGFGRTTVAARGTRLPTGPWSAAVDLFTPPESRCDRPFVYAAKAHPEIDAGAGWLAISYAANTFDFAELFSPSGQAGLYWPRFWRVPVATLPRVR